MESKLRRVENLDRAVQQLMLKMDAMDRRTNSQSDTIITKLDAMSKSVGQWDSVQSRLDKLDNLCSGRQRRDKVDDEEDDLVIIFEIYKFFQFYLKTFEIYIQSNLSTTTTIASPKKWSLLKKLSLLKRVVENFVVI